MTDILERIDKHLINDDAEQRNWDADGLLEDAAVEIEKLRLIHTDLWTLNGKQEREIETLKESLKKANAANSRLAQCNHKISEMNKELVKRLEQSPGHFVMRSL